MKIPQARLPEPEGRFRRPFAISLLLHALVIALFMWQAEVILELGMGGDEGPPGGGGGGGGREITYVALSPAPNAPREAEQQEVEETVRPVLPVFTPNVHEIVPMREAVTIKLSRPQLRMAKALGSGDGISGGPGSGPGSGGGQGSGRGTGVGSGDGPGTGGEGGDILPPAVRFSALPPMENRPASLRGRSFRVLFTVDQEGRVLDVRTEPRIDDAGYRKKFLDAMRRYRFSPATRRDGTAVVGLATVTVTL